MGLGWGVEARATGYVYTRMFQNDQPGGRCKWEIAGKGLAQHGEMARIERDEADEAAEEEDNKEEIEEDELDEVKEPEEDRPEKVKTVWVPDVELNRDFDDLNTTPSWYLMPVDE
jgi:hypothetical protein